MPEKGENQYRDRFRLSSNKARGMRDSLWLDTPQKFGSKKDPNCSVKAGCGCPSLVKELLSHSKSVPPLETASLEAETKFRDPLRLQLV